MAFYNRLTFIVLVAIFGASLSAAQFSITLKNAELPPMTAALIQEPPSTLQSKLPEVASTESLPHPTKADLSTPPVSSKTSEAPKTTSSPKTTTEAPKTTPSSNTTTPAPVTTPAPPVTTTQAPVTPPEVVTYNTSCILIQMAAQLNFTYNTTDGKKAYHAFNLPKSNEVDSICNVSQQLFVDFDKNTNNLEKRQIHRDCDNCMIMQFDKVNNSVILSMIMFTLAVNQDKYPDVNKNQTITLFHMGFDFQTPLEMSYHCTRSQQFNLTGSISDKTTLAVLKIHDLQVQAFRTDANSKKPAPTGFASAIDCDSPQADAVAIAVGIVLIALILVVLITYVCARRSFLSRGYVSF